MNDDSFPNILLFPMVPRLARQPDHLCITSPTMEADVQQVRDLWAQCDEIIASIDATRPDCADMLARVQQLRLERIVSFLKILDTRQQIRMSEIAVQARIQEARAAVAAHEEERAASGEAEVVSLSVARIAADDTLSDYEKVIAIHRAELAAAQTEDERRTIEGLITTLEQIGASSRTSPEADERRREKLREEIAALVGPPDATTE